MIGCELGSMRSIKCRGVVNLWHANGPERSECSLHIEVPHQNVDSRGSCRTSFGTASGVLYPGRGVKIGGGEGFLDHDPNHEQSISQ